MSPVSRAGSVTEISPRHSLLRKIFVVFIYEKLAWLRVLWPRSHWLGRNFLDKIASLPQHSGQNDNFCLECISALAVCELALLHESYHSRERCKFMFHHFGCFPWISPRSTELKFPISWQTTKLIPVTKPGAYEALNCRFSHDVTKIQTTKLLILLIF